MHVSTCCNDLSVGKRSQPFCKLWVNLGGLTSYTINCKKLLMRKAHINGWQDFKDLQRSKVVCQYYRL